MQKTILMIMAVALVGCASTPYTPGKPYTNTLGMKFVPVPGSEVSFCIWETRVKDYAVYAAASADVNTKWKNPGFTQADTHPVVNVSWNDAKAFCAWLTKKELAAGKLKPGQRYRLPTDSEWSVAVGLGKESGNTPQEKDGGIKGVYPWGKGYPPPKGAGNYSSSLKTDNFKYTSPVGSFPANQSGIYDLGGNAWEWCEDILSPPIPLHTVRGASWYSTVVASLLSSGRGDRTPDFLTYSFFGFRCVLASD